MYLQMLVKTLRVVNPLPYFADSDYFVLLSDSEALSYAVVEALSVNTKVLVTPQDAYAEFGLKDGENAVIVPYDYFEEENKEKLVDLIKKIYADKEREIQYTFNPDLYKLYNDLLK